MVIEKQVGDYPNYILEEFGTCELETSWTPFLRSNNTTGNIEEFIAAVSYDLPHNFFRYHNIEKDWELANGFWFAGVKFIPS